MEDTDQKGREQRASEAWRAGYRAGVESVRRLIDLALAGDAPPMPETWQQPVRPLPSGRASKYPPQHWQHVADVYRRALQEGWPPTRTVAETFGINHGTAGGWVANCRRRGLLGPTVMRHAGEQTRPEEE